MAGWVRSVSISEGVGYSRGSRTVENYFPEQIYFCTDDKFYSEGGFFHWQHKFEDRRKVSGSRPTLIWWTQPLGNIYLNDDDDDWLKWRWRFCGIRFGEIEDITDEGVNEFGKKVRIPRDRWYFLHVPYWPIVIPFTLISLWLLLAMPLPSTPKKISEAIANETG